VRDKIYDLLRRYQGAASFVLVLLVLGIAAGISVSAQELPEGLKGEHMQIPVICGDTMTLYKELHNTHGELPVAIGFTTNNSAVVWFVNEDKSTLSIVIDTPTQSCMFYTAKCLPGDCLMSARENYEREMKKEFPKNDSPKVGL
jgi:hypothetical protein